MKKSFHSLLFLLIFILLSKNIGSNQFITSRTKAIQNSAKGIWEGTKKVILKEELSIGVSESDESLMFYEPMDVEVDSEGNIYVLDKGNFRIQKFDKNGKFLLSFGGKGQGPGELLNCFDIELDSKGNVLVFDLDNSRISKFDSKGQFLATLKLEYQAMHGAIDSEDNIYVYERHNGKLIHKYDPNGRYLFSFMDEIKFEPKRIEPHINSIGNIEVWKDRVLLAMIYPYTIYIFTKNGELLEKIVTDVPYSQPPFLSPEGIVITNFIITGLAVSADGYIFNKAIYFKVPFNWKEKIKDIMENLYKNSFVDIFNPNGIYLLHQKIPDTVGGLSFDSKGGLYMIKQEEDYWKVVKYSVSFE